jgi:tetratricopeptide (TPR) repeat protein
LREIGIYVFLVGAFFVLERVELPGSEDMTAYYNTHAIVLDSEGREKEAMEYWKRSSRMNKSYSVFANLSLAGRFLKQKNPDSAMGYLNKISDESFGVAQKYALMGDVMMSERNVEGAVRAYEKSLSFNGGQRKVRQKLVAIYKGMDKRRAQVEYEKLRYISSFYDLL